MELNQEQISKFKDSLRYYLSSDDNKSWIDSLQSLKIKSSKVIFGGISHRIYRYEIRTNHETLLIKVLDEQFPEYYPFSNKIFEYKIGIEEKQNQSIQPEFDLDLTNEKELSIINNSINKNNFNTKDLTTNCNNKNLLNKFIPGDRNLLAIKACNVVVGMPGIAFNPFIIYGESGSGKTHLLEGICNEFQIRESKKNTVCVSAEDFLNDFINNLRSSNMKNFRDIYRKPDAFLLDDIEALLPSEKCQNELLHTIKSLRKKNSQIVIVSEKPPTHIKGLNSGLKRFLESGLTVDIGIPDNKTKIEILENKASERGIPFNNELANFIVSNIEGGIGRMEGILMRLEVHSSLLNEKLTISLAKDILKDWLSDSKGYLFTNESYYGEHTKIIDKILEKIKVLFQVTEQELISYKRERRQIKARQATVYLLKNLTSLSLNEIGKILGRNHSTVHAMLKKVRSKIYEDDFFLKQMQNILNEFENKTDKKLPSQKKQGLRL